MKLEALRGLRGGVIYHVVGVSPQTVRSWPITVGSRQGEGHPRYGFEDAILLSLMKNLTVDFAISAARAGAIVGELRTHLPDLTSDWEEELNREKGWRWHGGPFLIAPALRDGMAQPVSIVEEQAILGRLTDEHSRPANVVISLQALISRVVYRLQRVSSGEEPIFYVDDDTGLKLAPYNTLPADYQARMDGEA